MSCCVVRSIASTQPPPAFSCRVLYGSQPRLNGFRFPDVKYRSEPALDSEPRLYLMTIVISICGNHVRVHKLCMVVDIASVALIAIESHLIVIKLANVTVEFTMNFLSS